MTMKPSITQGQKRQLERVGSDAVGAAIETLGLDKESAQLVLSKGDVLKGAILDAMRKLAATIVGDSIIVDYGKKVKEMVAAGHYDWPNSDINDTNFPQSGTGVDTVNPELVHLNKDASSEDALAHMEANGLRPATLAELLAFGATYPEIQRQFPIIALGSSWVDSGGRRRVPCLFRSDGDRVLDLDWGAREWCGVVRFLAVRK